MRYCDGGGQGSLVLDPSIDWPGFQEWLRKNYRPKTVYDRFYYVRRYHQCLLHKDLHALTELTNDQRQHAMAGLSALSKFLGIHEEFRALIKNYGLKWSVRSDDLIIARFTKAKDPDSLFKWIREVKAACPGFTDFLEFMLTTGLRFEESINSFDLIVNLSREEKLKDYYDPDREILEHFRFKEIFLRHTKKAFVSFVPKALIERIARNEPFKTTNSVQKLLQRRRIPQKFGDIRELHGTLLSRHLSEVEINFLHGRISSSVFMANYFNAAWITDLKARTFLAVQEILAKI